MARFLSYRRGAEAVADRKTQMAMRGAGMTSIPGLSTAPESWIGPYFGPLRRIRNRGYPEWSLTRPGGERCPSVHLAFDHRVILLTLPSMAAELQGRASPAVTACWPRPKCIQIITFWCGSDRMPVDSELSPERRISRDSRGQRSSRSAIGVFEGERTERRL